MRRRSSPSGLSTNPITVLLIWLVTLGMLLYFTYSAIGSYQRYRVSPTAPISIKLNQAVTMVPEVGEIWVTIDDERYDCEHVFVYTVSSKHKITYTVVPIGSEVKDVIALVRTGNPFNCIEESNKVLRGRLSRMDRSLLNELHRYGFDLPGLEKIQRIFLFCPDCSPANDLALAITYGFSAFITIGIFGVLTRYLIKVL